MSMETKPWNIYVAGFAFNPTLDCVLLIEKAHPEWQAGLMNGVGGKIKPNETSLEAMKREFEEETGICERLDWRLFDTLSGQAQDDKYGAPWLVDFYYSIAPFGVLNTAYKMEDEFPVVVTVDTIQRRKDIIPNLRWLIPKAINILRGDERALRFGSHEYYERDARANVRFDGVNYPLVTLNVAATPNDHTKDHAGCVDPIERNLCDNWMPLFGYDAHMDHP